MESRELAVGYNGPVVEGEELGRRLKALRELRGISQVEFGELLAAEGFGKHDIGRVERGGMSMQGALRREAARLLRVPEDVFLADDVDSVLWRDEATQLERVEAKLNLILRYLSTAKPGEDAPEDLLGDMERELDSAEAEREDPPAVSA